MQTINSLEELRKVYAQKCEEYERALKTGDLLKIQAHGTHLQIILQQGYRLAGRLAVKRPELTRARLAGLDAAAAR